MTIPKRWPRGGCLQESGAGQPAHLLMRPEVPGGAHWAGIPLLGAGLSHYTFNELPHLKTIALHEMRAIQKMQDKGHHFNSMRHLYQWRYRDRFRGTSPGQLHTKLQKRPGGHCYPPPPCSALPLRVPWLPSGASLVCFSFRHLTVRGVQAGLRC